MKRLPWTHEELQALIPKLNKELEKIESEQEEEIKPLPAMTKDECMDYFYRLMDIAAERPLTDRECFIHGQLLCNFQMAVMAETLGKKGRFFVVSENDLEKLMRENDGSQ